MKNESIKTDKDFCITQREGYMYIEFTGRFSINAAKSAVDAMVNACIKANCTKALFDCRPMTGDLSTMDRFDIAQYGSSAIERTIKIAMLGRDDQLLPDKFFENVAVNRGLALRLFYDIDEAISWLKE